MTDTFLKMSIYFCQDTSDKCLLNIVGETKTMLDTIKDGLKQLGPDIYQKFKVNFLKRANYR